MNNAAELKQGLKSSEETGEFVDVGPVLKLSNKTMSIHPSKLSVALVGIALLAIRPAFADPIVQEFAINTTRVDTSTDTTARQAYGLSGGFTGDFTNTQNYSFTLAAPDNGFFTYSPRPDAFVSYLSFDLFFNGTSSSTQASLPAPTITFGGLQGTQPVFSFDSSYTNANIYTGTGQFIWRIRLQGVGNFSFNNVNISGSWADSNVGNNTFVLDSFSAIRAATQGPVNANVIRHDVLTYSANPAAVPEPSTWCLIAGCVALGVTVWKRSRFATKQ